MLTFLTPPLAHPPSGEGELGSAGVGVAWPFGTRGRVRRSPRVVPVPEGAGRAGSEKRHPSPEGGGTEGGVLLVVLLAGLAACAHDPAATSLAPSAETDRALGRAQAPKAVAAVLAGFADPSPAVGAAAVFAAGQFGLSWQPLPEADLDRLVVGLTAAAEVSHDLAERTQLARALGKFARPAAVVPLEKMLADAPPDLQREIGISLGRIAYGTQGKAPGLEAIEPLTAILLHGEPSARYGAAYALMRMKRAEARPALTFGIKDGEPTVRAVCARGLADVAEPTELPYLLERLGDPDEGVRVEAARALGKLGAKCPATGACPAAAAIDTALETLVKAYAPDYPATGMALLALAQEKLPPATQPALEKAIASLAPGESRDRRVIGCWLAGSLDHLNKAGATPALDVCKPGTDLVAWEAALQVHVLSESVAEAPVRAAALIRLPPLTPTVAGAVDDALGDLGVDTPAVRAHLLFDLTSPDFAIAISAADAAGKLKIAEAVPLLPRVLTLAEATAQDDGMATVLTHLAGLHAPNAAVILTRYLDDPRPTVRAGALAGLEVLKANPAVIPEPRARVAPPTEAGPLDRAHVARIRTSRGEMVLQLEAGSRTAGNFAQLARRSFYDGLTWHRVVPDFVVQGGDPRGDGSGGPGYTIPCEIGEQRYVRGAVGMALSGKDTGGSQFFITLSAQPHLEGKYTIFGLVQSGMEVADQLVEGDHIESVVIE